MPEGNTGDQGNPVAGLQALLARHNNDAMGVAGTLFAENYQYREQIRQLREQLQAAQLRVPAEGTVVLTAEQANAWAAYQGLGTVEVITQGLKDKDTAQGELTSLRRAATLRAAAETAGFDPDVLGTLAGGLEFELRDVTTDGKTVRAAFVKDGQNQLRLEEYAQQKWKKFTPALIPGRGQGGGAGSQGNGTGGQGAAGMRFPAQGAGGQLQGGDMVRQFMEEAEKARTLRPNPLLPKG